MQKTIDFINEKTNNFIPEVGIILGSGLGDFVNNFDYVSIPYSEIPGFETSTIKGHAGKLVFCKIKNKNTIIMQGRYHYYEGYSIQDIVYPVKVMKNLGVKTLIITNAAGAINKKFKPSDLMVITDHINMMGTNPLIGLNDETLGTRFPDMSEVYNKDLIKTAKLSAKELNLKIQSGVYVASTGPSYETPAEIKMFKKSGADAVGMSTAPEAIVANYCGINVLGISCITNYAAGISKNHLSHSEVIDSANSAKDKFQALLLKVLEKI